MKQNQNKQKIVILDALTLGDDIDLDIFKEFGELVIYDTTSSSEVLEHISDAKIVITNKVIIDANTMDNTNIKLICIAATGMNNIDLDYAKKKNIEVKNAVGYSTSSVAQLTFSIALEFIQNIKYYDNYVKSNEWSKSKIFTNVSKPFYELNGKVWGIIGLGNIGKEVATIAEAFGCKINYYSTSGSNNNTKYNNLCLDELLSSSDIISIHSPLNEQTNNLINKTNISMLKDDTILLNLGRGGIVNELDIANELDNRNIFYGTDVVTKEPIEFTSPLLKIVNKDRLIITPHIAWASKEARVRLINIIKDNIKEFIL
ncbi:MAG: D-2-hydroxyacid dehydrogenase [Arcobacteraceae bacterium]|nr:D-2-hydroxyacid dehydrogenase [Arcobacteraceae bacterium]